MDVLTTFGIVLTVLVGSVIFGFYAVRTIKMSPQELVIGGRSFGTILLYVLLAGESYTSFTFLGAAGWAYGKGAPAYYILSYLILAFVILFLLGPLWWRRGRQLDLLTNADFFVTSYQSPFLGLFVAVCGVFFLVLYLTVQLTGIQILLQIAGYGRVTGLSAGAIAFFLIVIFVFLSGLRGVAWVSVIKDGFMLGAILFAGFVIPMHFFGTPEILLSKLREAHPGWLTLRTDASANGIIWFVSTVLLTGLGGYMWPHSIAAIYSAKDEESIRRNAMLLPFYQLIQVFVLFAGFSALLLTPGLKGEQADQSFMLIVQRHYPPWALGLVVGAGCLAALVPGSSLILAAASLIAKNVVGTFSTAFATRHQTTLTRISIIGVSLFAFVSWVLAKTTLVGMLLVAYNGTAQLFPGMVLGFASRRPSALSIGIGLAGSLIFLSWAAAYKIAGPWGINIGLIALVLNFILLGMVLLVEELIRWAARRTNPDLS